MEPAHPRSHKPDSVTAHAETWSLVTALATFTKPYLRIRMHDAIRPASHPLSLISPGVIENEYRVYVDEGKPMNTRIGYAAEAAIQAPPTFFIGNGSLRLNPRLCVQAMADLAPDLFRPEIHAMHTDFMEVMRRVGGKRNSWGWRARKDDGAELLYVLCFDEEHTAHAGVVLFHPEAVKVALSWMQLRIDHPDIADRIYATAIEREPMGAVIASADDVLSRWKASDAGGLAQMARWAARAADDEA